MSESIIQMTTISMVKEIYTNLVIVASQNGVNLGSMSAKDKAKNIAILKKEGMLPGASDIVIYLPEGKCVHLEFKTDKGKQSTKQEVFQTLIEDLGHKYFIVRSPKDVFDVLKEVLSFDYRIEMAHQLDEPENYMTYFLTDEEIEIHESTKDATLSKRVRLKDYAYDHKNLVLLNGLMEKPKYEITDLGISNYIDGLMWRGLCKKGFFTMFISLSPTYITFSGNTIYECGSKRPRERDILLREDVELSLFNTEYTELVILEKSLVMPKFALCFKEEARSVTKDTLLPVLENIISKLDKHIENFTNKIINQ